VCRGRGGRAAIRTPCGRRIRPHKLGGGFQDYRACLDYRQLRDNPSRNVETLLGDAICLARSRHNYQTCVLKSWVIHGRVTVVHSWHRVRRLTAMALSLQSGVSFTHERADPGGGNNPGQQNSQENYRSCGSWGHFPNCTLRPKRSANLGEVTTPWQLVNKIAQSLQRDCSVPQLC